MKTIITISFFLSCLSINAQVDFGVMAGVNYSNLHERINYPTGVVRLGGDRRPGMTAGLFANFPVFKSIHFQPGVNFHQNRLQYAQQSNGDLETKLDIKYNSLEIPLNLVYRTKNKGENFWMGAGPSVNFNLKGKATATYDNEKESIDMSFGNDDDDNMQKMNFTGNALIGFESNIGIIFLVNYNFGLSNLYPGKQDKDDSKEAKLKSTSWGVRVAYIF